MKKRIKLLAVLIFGIGLSCARQEVLKPVQTNETKTYKSVGVVKSVDPDGKKITIDREAKAGEMTENVSDAKMLETLKTGDQVDFEMENSGSRTVITKLTKIGETAVVNGGEIYKTNCAECHGGLGEGAPKGISLLQGHALQHSENEYIKQVTNGKGKKMPAFKDKLHPEQIEAVVKFVREELQKETPKEETPEHQH
jgi:mono/diheme cytochrome c family protein